MLSRIAQRTVRAVKPTMATRSFGEVLSIPVDKEQQTGRRKEELDAEAAGHVGFNKDPIIPAADAGTRENPILVSFKVLTKKTLCLLLLFPLLARRSVSLTYCFGT